MPHCVRRMANATANSLLAQQQAAQAANAAPRTFSAQKGGDSDEGLVSSVLTALDQRRTGLAPMVILGSLVALVLLIAIIRAAASARGEHKGLCFLAKLGINIGEGCGEAAEVKHQAEKEIEKLLDQTPRVHDIEVEEKPGGRRMLSEVWGRVVGGWGEGVGRGRQQARQGAQQEMRQRGRHERRLLRLGVA
jgi:hypothetical protein